MRRFRLACGVGLGLLLVGSSSSPAVAGPALPVTSGEVDPEQAVRDQADAWSGRYRFVGGQAQRDGRDAAVEGIVEQLNVLLQGIARDRLIKANQIPKTLTVSRDGDRLTVSRDGQARTVGLDGKKIATKNSFGDPIDYRVEVGDRRLREFIAGKGGRRTNTWRRRGNGRITVTVRITSPRLPEPLVYSLTYAKQ